MGRMSYAAYLWHIDVLKFLEWAAPTKFAFAGSLSALAFSATAAAATFFIAWLSHIAIYEPVLKLRRSYGSRAH
jgi:peptidoglycan/LPS O-acetylase OafA/YrhL